MIINVQGFNIPVETKNTIKRILDQIEHHNFAVVSDFKAVRSFSFNIPNIYKSDGTLLFSRNGKQSKSVVTLNQDFTIDRLGDFKFKIVLKK